MTRWLGTGRVGTTAHWPACSDRHAEANRCPGCAGHAHGARRLGLPAILIEADLEPTSIQALKNSDPPRRRYCPLDPGRQFDRFEDRLTGVTNSACPIVPVELSRCRGIECVARPGVLTALLIGVMAL